MARLKRQVGIQTATVRLPTHTSVGPALIRTASKVADMQFAKAADKRTQEAQIAAAAINFERDGDGNLLAPSLPIGENGLLAPSIYDRAYTHMVSQRYLQQINIDTSERLNFIATKNRFDPDGYRELAEAYVAKVTELAPDRLKSDVNNTAQVRMVEHFNLIVRQKSERDHDEARGVHVQTINRTNDEMVQYIEAGASPEIIGAKMLEVRALIEQGDAFNFWLDDEKADMIEDIDRAYAVANIISTVTSLPDDPLVHAEAIEKLNDFANGIGTLDMVDEAGNLSAVPLNEIPISPEERQLIATHAILILNQKQAAFSNLRDNRLKRDYETFFNWFSPHALQQRTSGEPLDMDRLYEEFDKANSDVINFNYDDTLRENIRRIIEGEFDTDTGNMSQWRKDFLPGWHAYQQRYSEELEKRLVGRNRDNISNEELMEIEHGARMAIGNVAGGNKQTAPGAREIKDFYGGMTGRDYTQTYFENLIANPDDPAWGELKGMVDVHMSKVGIWPMELTDAIVGKINAPEGMNIETLQATLDLARIFWDNPTFRNNMMDDNALGPHVGGALNHLFKYGGQPSIANVTKMLENYSNPSYSPELIWSRRDTEDRQAFRDMAEAAIQRKFVSTFRTLWIPKGLQTQGFGFNPFDDDLAGIPVEVMDGVMDHLIANAGFIDTNDSSSFDPFVHRTVDRIMHDKGYAPSQMGYSEVRHDDQYHSSFFDPFRGYSRPDSAIVQHPPEYFATRDKDGNLDRQLMDMVEENFQVVLDYYGDLRGEEWKVDVNAALEYDGQASVALGYPSWSIRLLHAGGGSEILTEDGLLTGQRILFDMREAEIRNQKRKDDEAKKHNQSIRSRRQAFQDSDAADSIGFGPHR